MKKAIDILKQLLDANKRGKFVKFEPQEIEDAIAEAEEPLRISYNCFRIEYHSKGEAPNAYPLLKIYDCRQFYPNDSQPLVAEIELDDFTGSAQVLFERELQSNLGLEKGSAKFKSRVRALRKALGYSYP